MPCSACCCCCCCPPPRMPAFCTAAALAALAAQHAPAPRIDASAAPASVALARRAPRSPSATPPPSASAASAIWGHAITEDCCLQASPGLHWCHSKGCAIQHEAAAQRLPPATLAWARRLPGLQRLSWGRMRGGPAQRCSDLRVSAARARCTTHPFAGHHPTRLPTSLPLPCRGCGISCVTDTTNRCVNGACKCGVGPPCAFPNAVASCSGSGSCTLDACFDGKPPQHPAVAVGGGWEQCCGQGALCFPCPLPPYLPCAPVLQVLTTATTTLTLGVRRTRQAMSATAGRHAA